MLTNAHVWAGYSDPNTYVPTPPFTCLRVERGYEVRDARNHWLATWRNHEDAARHVESGEELAKRMEAASKEHYDNSPVDTGDEDRTLCRICLKYFDGIAQHTKAKHNTRLGKMLEMKVPTEREFREFHNKKGP